MNHPLHFGKRLSTPPPGEEVVISGISGRLPESDDILTFKKNLFNKTDMVTGDHRRWKPTNPEIPQRNGKIHNIDKLDAGFFGIHHRQAELLNPLSRKVLETSVEAILDSGMNPSELEGTKTGVFVGVCFSDLESIVLKRIGQTQSFGITGYLKSFIPNRLSYFLKLKGPSCVVDTACSSSLYALEQAVKSIRMGQCDAALVAGANLLLHPGVSHQFALLGAVSSDGISKVFDQEADGYTRSESVVCVFLQKSKRARRIYAQILHSKTNSDGFKHLGITYPSSQMQEELMVDILKESGTDPADLDYLEAHSTGTQAGDPQEVQAIDNAIARKRTKPLFVGSVKSNMGHSEAASGLCSLAKVLIAMETGYLPPNIHLKNIKKGLLGFEEGRMKVVMELTPFQGDVVGINNFGWGGSNCHLLLKRNGKVRNEVGGDLARLICVSGRTKTSVLKMLEDINSQPLNYEYADLIQHIFKKDVSGHFYRGFTVVSKNGVVNSSLKRFEGKRKSLCVVFGEFEEQCEVVGENLLEFPCFKTFIKKIDDLLHSLEITEETQTNKTFLAQFSVQIGIVEIIKLLELEVNIISDDSLSKILRAYYLGDIPLSDAIYFACDLDKTQAKYLDCVFSRLEKTSLVRYKKFKENYHGNQHISKSSTPFEDLPTSDLILNISDRALTGLNILQLVKNQKSIFLETLGRIYEEGYNCQLHKLYPTIRYPVSCGTPPIAPSIRWDYHKTWDLHKYIKTPEPDVVQQEYEISPESFEDQGYLLGHVVDGRTLIPASEYLHLVWKTISDKNSSIVFDNCEFIKAVTLPKSGSVRIIVSVERLTGIFEVVEKDTIVKGKVSLTDSKETKLACCDINKHGFLEENEIYRELQIRGYNYSGLFRGIVKCNIEATVALMRWDNNWTTFIDNMLQLMALQLDTKSLFVPIGIRKLSISVDKHVKFVNDKMSLCPVYYYHNCDIVKSGGIEICGLKVAPIPKKKTPTPVLEKYVFVSNNAKLTLKESITVVVQIILEDSLETNFKAIELVDDSTDFLLSLVSKYLQDVPLVVANLALFSDRPVKTDEFPVKTVLSSTKKNLLIIAKKIFQRPKLFKQALETLGPKGFLLTRDESYFSTENFEIMCQHSTGDEKLILLKKVQREAFSVVEIKSEDYDWLPQLQTSLQQGPSVIIYSQNQKPEGILGLVNCLRREQRSKVRCFFMMDEAPKFNIDDPFYKNQIKKQMAINVYKNSTWGTYRHLVLDVASNVESRHVFVNNGEEGLTSLKWVEGGLAESKPNKTVIFPFYSALNFRDVMIASRRVHIEMITKDRREQECSQGLEYCGRDSEGRRVMGITTGGGISTMVLADRDLQWEVPGGWSLQEASTLPVVYATVIYALLKVATLRPGMSILIHSAAGGIGLAAINVCLYHGCRVYVTVGTREKREYLIKNFPQIPESHIGNSRNTSFEEMIKTKTKGRGVDIVLNSLSEEKLKASIRCVGPGGYFLEIGKFDLTKDASLSLLLLERKISYHGVMLDQIFAKLPIKRWIYCKVQEGIKCGYVKPLPRTVFQKEQILEAYRHMSKGEHIGKVVVEIRNENDKSSLTNEVFIGTPRFNCDPDKSYIIVGGLGGFGLELADWLYLRGAKKLVLVSRVGIKTEYQKRKIRNWNFCGVTVRISTQDTTSQQGCMALIDEANRLGVVDGIFNLAVILKDALFEDQTEETFRASVNPKGKTTIHLDEITRQFCPKLKYFVVFSSVSCGRGNSGQTNYGMANSIMERICERRKSDGLPGLAIQWGAIGDVGLVAEMQKEGKELVIGGTLQQKISNCLEVLDILLKQDNPVVSSMVVATKETKTATAKRAIDLVAYILGIKDVKNVNLNTCFSQLGMDSITASEIVQSLERDFDISLTSKEIRNMTFTRLMDLEKEKNERLSDKAKENASIINFIPPLHSTYVTMELPSRRKDDAVTVFVLPGIEGVFEGLEVIAKNLEVTVVGISYAMQEDETTVEECARSILPIVEETVSKQGRFYLLSHSFGTIVAGELAVLLEKKGFTGLLFNIEGSPSYISSGIRKTFNCENNTEFQTSLLLKIMKLLLPDGHVADLKDNLLKCPTFHERINLLKSYLPLQVREKYTFEEPVVIYNRLKMALSYRFVHKKIKSKVYLFKASFPVVSDCVEDYQLSELCEQPVEVIVVEGDHLTILSQIHLAETINVLLKNDNKKSGEQYRSSDRV